MSGTGVFYTTSQQSAMQAAITAAKTAQNANNPAGVLTALNNYYSTQLYQPGTQTLMRGYAISAMQVLNNTGSGIVANNEVSAAVGKGNYTPAYQANLALTLATTDFNEIQASGYEVPTLADDATTHLTAFNILGIPITAWGGTPFVALGQDFTLGQATSAEQSSVQPEYFSNLQAADVDNSLQNLFSAGLNSSGSLDIGSDISGSATIEGLMELYNAKFFPYVPNFVFGQNQDGSYQVTELYTDTEPDGIYKNYSDSGQSVYTIDIENSNSTPDTTDVSVDTGNGISNFSIAGSTPNVIVDSNANSDSATKASDTILIGNSGATLNGGSGQDLLIALGTDVTINGGTGSAQILLAGINDLANVSNDVIALGADANGNVVGSNNVITESVLVALGIYGSNNTVNATSETLIYIGNTNGVADTVNVSNNNSNQTAADGQTTGLVMIADTQVNLTGAFDGVQLSTRDSLGAFGGGNVINGTSSTLIYVANTNGTADTIFVDGDQSGGTTANGQPTGVAMIANVQVNLTGSNNGIQLSTGDSLGAFGGGNTLNGGAGEDIYIADTNSNYDTIIAIGDAFGGVTANGQSTGISLTANVQANVEGSDDGIYLGAAVSLGAFGGGHTIDSGPGDSVILLNTGGNFDTVNANGDQFGGSTVTGEPIGIYLTANTQANVVGSNNGINLANGINAGIFGGANTIQSGAGDALTLLNTNGADDTVMSTGDQAGGVTALGQSAAIVLSNAGAQIIGSSNTIYLETNSSANLSGSNNTVNLIASGSAVSMSAGSGNTFNVTGGVSAEVNLVNPDGSRQDESFNPTGAISLSVSDVNPQGQITSETIEWNPGANADSSTTWIFDTTSASLAAIYDYKSDGSFIYTEFNTSHPGQNWSKFEVDASSNGTTHLGGPEVWDAGGNAYSTDTSPLVNYQASQIIAESTEINTPLSYQSSELFANAHTNGNTWEYAHNAVGTLEASAATLNSAVSSTLTFENGNIGHAITSTVVTLVGYGP